MFDSLERCDDLECAIGKRQSSAVTHQYRTESFFVGGGSHGVEISVHAEDRSSSSTEDRQPVTRSAGDVEDPTTGDISFGKAVSGDVNTPPRRSIFLNRSQS